MYQQLLLTFQRSKDNYVTLWLVMMVFSFSDLLCRTAMRLADTRVALLLLTTVKQCLWNEQFAFRDIFFGLFFPGSWWKIHMHKSMFYIWACEMNRMYKCEFSLLCTIFRYAFVFHCTTCVNNICTILTLYMPAYVNQIPIRPTQSAETKRSIWYFPQRLFSFIIIVQSCEHHLKKKKNKLTLIFTAKRDN